jgi:hypothetical protein
VLEYVVRFKEPGRQPETVRADRPWVLEGYEYAFYATARDRIRRRIAFPTSEVQTITQQAR